jgi:hypothetical protein
MIPNPAIGDSIFILRDFGSGLFREIFLYDLWGSWIYPAKRLPLKFGLGSESAKYSSLMSLYLRPFFNIFDNLCLGKLGRREGADISKTISSLISTRQSPPKRAPLTGDDRNAEWRTGPTY